MMGSSESGGLGLLDSRIGSIVWVRRRNGSWWPGKILGTDELSASHLMSPRSGTPVKLLGREDASVDWYNLEKSKRVKTFRCGEFDDCIERAEASLGLPAKKREKYARREDAILHALELEKEIIEKNCGQIGINASSRNNSCGSAGKDLHTTLGDLRNGNGRLESMDLQHIHKKGISPVEDECNINLLSTQKGQGGAWQNSDNSGSNTFVGGSQDFILPKKIISAASSPLLKGTSDDQAQAVPADSVCGDVDSGNSKDKGKGLLDISIEESSIKIYDRRRPLVHVLHGSTTWPGHSLQPDGDTFSMSGVNNQGEDAEMRKRSLLYLHSQLTDIMDIKGDPDGQMENLAPHQVIGIHSHTDAFQKDATSESSEGTESDSGSSETDSMEHCNSVEMIRYSDVLTPMELQSTALNGLEQQRHHPSSSSEKSDKSFPHDMPSFYQKNPVSLDLGVSRWQMKGKRNVRNFSRRSIDKFTCGTYLEPRSLLQRPNRGLSYHHGHEGYNNEVDFVEDGPEPFIGGGYGRGGHIGKSQAASRRWNSPGSNMPDLEELKWRDSSFGGYCGDGFGSSRAQELLLDVGLKVQANNKREHVPFVSLMSRLNGKPIIGHPVQIETLADGSTDALFSSTDAFEHFESDDANRVSPAWTTSRRTSKFRAPRPPLSELDDVDNRTVDEDQKPQFRKSVSAKKKNVASRISHQAAKLPSSERMNPPKRSNSSSSQKIRPLSSLGMNQKLVSEPRHSGLKRYMDGAIKPLDCGPPIVACIPVKLVFSRLLEAVGRPASMPSSHQGFSEQQ